LDRKSAAYITNVKGLLLGDQISSHNFTLNPIQVVQNIFFRITPKFKISFMISLLISPFCFIDRIAIYSIHRPELMRNNFTLEINKSIPICYYILVYVDCSIFLFIKICIFEMSAQLVVYLILD
jgi:hypothetical protein